LSDTKSLNEINYPECEFGGYSRVDGTVAFYSRIGFVLKPDDVVLDVGCGRGAFASSMDIKPNQRVRMLRERCAKVIGIDVSADGATNPLLDEFRLIEGDRWPIDDASIDLLYADYVLEHVEHPEQFFAECGRVLKPGGLACFRTPNRWGYVSIAARLIPNRYHARVTCYVQSGRREEDVFPTYFRANSKFAVRALLRDHGFDGCVLRHEGEPSYLAFSRWAYAVGVRIHRWLPGPLQSTLLVFARRQ
jgi:SAM-dependent methyltransferase